MKDFEFKREIVHPDDSPILSKFDSMQRYYQVKHDICAQFNPDVIAEKRRRETTGMNELLALGNVGAGDARAAGVAAADILAVNAGAGTGPVQQLWEEYEENATPVARFVRDMNLIDMCAQALRYEEAGRYDPVMPNRHFPDFQGMDEFFATTRPRLATAVGRELFDRLVERYSALPRVRERGGPRLESGTE